MKIACVQLQPDLPTFWDIVPAPRYGTMVIASALKQAGFEVIGLVENISRDIEKQAEAADIVTFTILTPCAEKSYRMADELRKKGKIVIFGGSHPYYFPVDSLKHCDYVGFGDCEIELVELVKRLGSGGKIDNLPGIGWMENGKLVYKPRGLNPSRYKGVVNIELIKDYPRFIRKRKRSGWAPLLLQATRGCPFDCSFCVTKDLFGPRYFTRGINEVIADLKDKLKYTTDIYFVDNNFAGNLAFTRKLVQAMIDEGISMNATAYVRHEFSAQTDLLLMMRKVGFTRLLVGIESFIDGTLEDFAKDQSFAAVQESIKTFQRHGFRTSGTFIMGAGTETPDTAKRYLQVARDLNLDYAFFFIYGVYPQMCNQFISAEHVFLNDYKYGTGHFIFFFPPKIRPSYLQHELIRTHLKFYSPGRILNRLIRGKWKDVAELVLHRRLFKRLVPHVKAYTRSVRKLEEGLYKGNNLDVDALHAASIPKLPCYT